MFSCFHIVSTSIGCFRTHRSVIYGSQCCVVCVPLSTSVFWLCKTKANKAQSSISVPTGVAVQRSSTNTCLDQKENTDSSLLNVRIRFQDEDDRLTGKAETR